MSSEFGNLLKISVFGQSHGKAIGVVVDGLPAGEAIDLEALNAFLARRKPGKSPLSTARKESDTPVFLSGLENGVTCGAPLCAVIENGDQHSSDYDQLRDKPRPGHADYTAYVKWRDQADMRGGGHFSGRLTAPLCIAGGIARQILSRRGVYVGAHLWSVGTEQDAPFPLRPTKELFETVGLTPPADFMEKHPNQLSGGQRQRIVIARALAVEPSIMVADEPTSMLDVSIGIEIMNLMMELKEKKKLTYLYITHNLASARYMADRMVVIYAGNCVEEGEMEDVLQQPLHPYTILLLNSTPEPFREEQLEIHASENLPDLTGPMNLCPFSSRCPKASERCRTQKPPVYQVGRRKVKCFLYENAQTEADVKLDAGIYQEAGDAG